MLAKMPVQVERTEFKKRSETSKGILIFGILLLIGLGLSAGYLISPMLHAPTTAVINNTTTETLYIPASHTKNDKQTKNDTTKNTTRNITIPNSAKTPTRVNIKPNKSMNNTSTVQNVNGNNN
jgi:hypothetical protein